MKYGPDYPGSFEDIDHAAGWVEQFVQVYNTAHHHSGVAGFIPQQAHDGRWVEVSHLRQQVLDRVYAVNPGRYRNPPTVDRVEPMLRINIPKGTAASQASVAAELLVA